MQLAKYVNQLEKSSEVRVDRTKCDMTARPVKVTFPSSTVVGNILLIAKRLKQEETFISVSPDPSVIGRTQQREADFSSTR